MGLGWGLIEAPSVVLPLTLQSLALLGVTAFILSREAEQRIRTGLTRIVALAITLRAGAFVGTHVVLSPGFFAPDSIGYARLGRDVALAWAGLGPPPQKAGAAFQIYGYENAVFYAMYGDPEVAASVLNLFMGVWTAIVTFYLGRRVLNERTGWIAATLVAAFPSLVLWSVLNIRDAQATLMVTLAVLIASKMVGDRIKGSTLLAFGFVVLFLGSLRDYMAFLVVTGATVGAIASARPGQMGRSLAVGTVLVVVGAYLGVQTGMLVKVQAGEALSTAEQIRSGMQAGANSAFGQTDFDTSSLGGALRYLPLGMAFILFAPFPWDVSSALQRFTMPEVLLWYAFVPFFLIGVRQAMKRRGSPHLVALTVFMVVVATYGLVEGNVGTAYRHRAQIMPLAMLYVAGGLTLGREWLLGLVSKRKKPSRRRRRSFVRPAPTRVGGPRG